MFYLFLWLLQDLLNVLAWGFMQVPEFFLLGLVYQLLTEERDIHTGAVWIAFSGGLIWDLRWVGIPGFFTLGYVIVVMFVLWLWNTLPASGRTLYVVLLLLYSSQLIPPLLPLLLLGGETGGSFFWAQQLCALPIVLLCVYLYTRHKRMKNSNV